MPRGCWSSLTDKTRMEGGCKRFTRSNTVRLPHSESYKNKNDGCLISWNDFKISNQFVFLHPSFFVRYNSKRIDSEHWFHILSERNISCFEWKKYFIFWVKEVFHILSERSTEVNDFRTMICEQLWITVQHVPFRCVSIEQQVELTRKEARAP